MDPPSTPGRLEGGLAVPWSVGTNVLSCQERFFCMFVRTLHLISKANMFHELNMRVIPSKFVPDH